MNKMWVIYDADGNPMFYFNNEDTANSECASWNRDYKSEHPEEKRDPYYVGSVDVN